ncbi:MAG: endonuclease/exonuclease/phosphatase family protein [Methylocystaceae bacterium]|nr:endonuclease/exonuclease/phosphatase family protein [Methylocystaceae bacterium]
MKILSWNIQSTRGCDGRFDFDRIYKHIIPYQADVICLQEISRNFSEYGGNDQLQLFKEAFQQYNVIWAPAMSLPFKQNRQRREFGNLTLVREGLLQDARVHSLPNPPAQGMMQMPRSLVEARIQYHEQVLCLYNTHLAYHNYDERQAQVEYISQLKAQGLARCAAPFQQDGEAAYEVQQEADHFMLCGDLNLTPHMKEYEYLITQGKWMDSWTILYPDAFHEATCGIFDREQWNEGANCRDFFMVSPSLDTALNSLEVDQNTDASDHQPIFIELK